LFQSWIQNRHYIYKFKNPNMQAEIICIGDELLIGQTINTNASWLGDQLNKIGIRVRQVHTIADDREAITTTIEFALRRSEVVIITGGLGPTKDDITKHTLCQMFDSRLVMNDEALQRIEGFMRARNLPILEVNQQQAALPHNCRIVQNHKGTACGMWFERDGHHLISMPGVPYEMQGMMTEEVLPSLISSFDLPHIQHRTILTIGVGESFLAKSIQDWESSLASYHIHLAYLPSPGSVKLRMSHYGGGEMATTLSNMQQKEAELKVLLGDIIYGYDNDTLSQVVGRLLSERSHTLAVAESCTGGYLGHLITSMAGSSGYFKGGIISYATEVKTGQLGISPSLIETSGVVSEAVALAMAEGVRQKLGSTFGVGITGIAGPDGGTPDLPVGTVCIAVSSPYGKFSKKEVLGRSRERTIQVAAQYALNYLRKEILRTDAC
jgi:nicotinamide-nucleotide amidase